MKEPGVLTQPWEHLAWSVLHSSMSGGHDMETHWNALIRHYTKTDVHVNIMARHDHLYVHICCHLFRYFLQIIYKVTYLRESYDAHKLNRLHKHVSLTPLYRAQSSWSESNDLGFFFFFHTPHTVALVRAYRQKQRHLSLFLVLHMSFQPHMTQCLISLYKLWTSVRFKLKHTQKAFSEPDHS